MALRQSWLPLPATQSREGESTGARTYSLFGRRLHRIRCRHVDNIWVSPCRMRILELVHGSSPARRRHQAYQADCLGQMHTVGSGEGSGQQGKFGRVDDNGAVQEGLGESAHPPACEREVLESYSAVALVDRVLRTMVEAAPYAVVVDAAYVVCGEGIDRGRVGGFCFHTPPGARHVLTLARKRVAGDSRNLENTNFSSSLSSGCKTAWKGGLKSGSPRPSNVVGGGSTSLHSSSKMFRIISAGIQSSFGTPWRGWEMGDMAFTEGRYFCLVLMMKVKCGSECVFLG